MDNTPSTDYSLMAFALAAVIAASVAISLIPQFVVGALVGGVCMKFKDRIIAVANSLTKSLKDSLSKTEASETKQNDAIDNKGN